MRFDHIASAAAVILLLACSVAPSQAQVRIQRSPEGIPHIIADDWKSLGYGYGYAQAEDNLCTLAEAFVTYRGERSRNFGGDAAPSTHSTVNVDTNIDSDFFFRFVEDPRTIAVYRDRQPARIRDLAAGYAQGYNAYLRQLRAGLFPDRHVQCRGAPWLATIQDDDIYRRLYSANLAGGLSQFATAIVTARPPGAPARRGAPAPQAAAAELTVGGKPGIGSNGIALGGSATGMPSGMLLGNPHWYWAGPDRFYAARLTLPGRLDVAGAAFLGVPLIMLGYNADVAWTHTVSTARRFGLFELSLAPGDGTRYLYEGKAERMTPVSITVPERTSDGRMRDVTRTLYKSRHGPLVNLVSYSPQLAWTKTHAYAMRDINAANYGIFANFLAWDQARSLDEFIDIQKRYAAMPWVNTLAVGRGDTRAWYADIGAMPNVPDALADRCTTPAGKAFDKAVPGVPFLDGSRSACAWRSDDDSRMPGALPPRAMPSLVRADYVANMNNSYALANPHAPLSGYDRVIGAADTPLSLRARSGYLQVDAMLEPRGSTHATPQALRALALASPAYSAQLLKQPLIGALCERASMPLSRDPATGKPYDAPRDIPTGAACKVLRDWADRALPESRGAYLWQEIWQRLSKIPEHDLYTVPFDKADPLHTPRGLNTASPAVLDAAAQAIDSMLAANKPLDTPWGNVLAVDMNGAHIRLYGGCDSPGYFTAACPSWGKKADGRLLPDSLVGNSYMQVVSFNEKGVRVEMMLAHGESDDPASPWYTVMTRRYAARQWTSWGLEEPGAR